MTFDHRYTTRKPWESDPPESLDMLKMDKQFHIDTETRRDTLEDYIELGRVSDRMNYGLKGFVKEDFTLHDFDKCPVCKVGHPNSDCPVNNRDLNVRLYD